MAKKACLCKNGTYHVDCCDGSLHAQGIGSEKGQSTTTINGVVKNQQTIYYKTMEMKIIKHFFIKRWNKCSNNKMNSLMN